MRWRILAAVAASLVLALPLVLSVGAAKYLPSPGTWKSRELSPVLSKEQLRELLTFQRECRDQSDCEAPLGCMDAYGTRGLCLASECLSDLQCAAGYTCRTMDTLGNGPLVRFCVPEGVLEEGAPCSGLPRSAQTACKPGLRCNGHCGRPCQPGEPTSCPEGFSCQDGVAGASCKPRCEGRECPTGQRCVRLSEATSVCAVVHGEDCERHPCPAGQTCRSRYHPGAAGKVTQECVVRCGDRHPPCPDATTCYAGDCRKPCRPEDLASCGPRQKCVFRPVDKLWLCNIRNEAVAPEPTDSPAVPAGG